MNYCACIDFCKPEISVKKNDEEIGTAEWVLYSRF